MEEKNIIFLVIILLVILYGCERLLLFTRENFTENKILQNNKINNNKILQNNKINNNKILQNNKINNNQINNNQINNNKNCNDTRYIVNKFDHESISIKKGEYLKNIVNKLIVELNKKTELKFKFVEFEHVVEQIFNNGIKRFIIDFFIHETENYFNKRLILDILIEGDDGIVKNLVIGNGRKETINNMEVNHYNFDQKIIDDDNLKLSNLIQGLNNSKLEFGVTNLKNSMDRNRNFKTWIEPKNKLTGPKKTWPCREQSIWWDENGVKHTQIPNSNCMGINSSYSPSLKVAQFRPTHKNRNKGDNDWVFSNYLQIGSDISILP